MGSRGDPVGEEITIVGRRAQREEVQASVDPRVRDYAGPLGLLRVEVVAHRVARGVARVAEVQEGVDLAVGERHPRGAQVLWQPGEWPPPASIRRLREQFGDVPFAYPCRIYSLLAS